MKRLTVWATALAIVASISIGAAQEAPKSTLVDSAQLLLDLKTLSADDMQGRQVDTPGGAKARAYVIDRFKASGIAPFGASYESPFTFTSGGANPVERHGVNVVGQIAGSGGFQRYIVVSAHYDHIGVRNGQVFNGADDNASGTAALFAIAKYFSTHKPVNSILFVAFDGEESNLRGSKAFVAKPPVDASLLALDLNADMIGRDPNDKLFVVGTRLQPFLKSHVEAIAAKAPVKLLIGHEDPKQAADDWTADSDHYSFIQAKIPALYFGVEDEGQHHKSTDDYETMTYGFYVRAVETLVQAVQYFDKNLDAIGKARLGLGAGVGAPAQAAQGAALTATTPQLRPGESPVELTIPGGKVFGTLLTPPGAGKKPVVLIIAGSGPTDRDGNSIAGVKAGSYKLLADALAAEGIASLRYDKRAVAASVVTGLKETDLRFDDYVTDAVSWIKQLRADARFSKVIVAGHSEGSLIGMMAARDAGADAFISMAGVAQPAGAAIRDQLRPQIGMMPGLWDGSQSVLASLEAGTTVDPLPPAIMAVPNMASLYRLSVQPYLISWFKYSGAVEIATLKMPVLIVQGTTDIQVAVSEATALAAAKPDATLTIIDGMNHLLKAAPADRMANIATYTNTTLPLVSELPKAVVTFVKGVR